MGDTPEIFNIRMEAHDAINAKIPFVVKNVINVRLLANQYTTQTHKKVCRVCLTEGCISIYGEYYSKRLVSALNNIGGIKINDIDIYPKYLCVSCYTLLQFAVIFRRTAQTTDTFLKKHNHSVYVQSKDCSKENGIYKKSEELLVKEHDIVRIECDDHTKENGLSGNNTERLNLEEKSQKQVLLKDNIENKPKHIKTNDSNSKPGKTTETDDNNIYELAFVAAEIDISTTCEQLDAPFSDEVSEPLENSNDAESVNFFTDHESNASNTKDTEFLDNFSNLVTNSSGTDHHHILDQDKNELKNTRDSESVKLDNFTNSKLSALEGVKITRIINDDTFKLHNGIKNKKMILRKLDKKPNNQISGSKPHENPINPNGSSLHIAKAPNSVGSYAQQIKKDLAGKITSVISNANKRPMYYIPPKKHERSSFQIVKAPNSVGSYAHQVKKDLTGKFTSVISNANKRLHYIPPKIPCIKIRKLRVADPNVALRKEWEANGAWRSKGNDYKCEECNTQHNLNTYLRHFKVKHPEQKKAKCHICQKFYAINSFERHMHCHKKGEYVCDVCGKTFLEKSNFLKHREIHSKYLPHKCTLCPYRGRNPRSVKIHMRSHQEKMFQCHLCPQRFISSGNLNRHLLVHNGTRPYECETCNRKYYGKAELKGHIKAVHLGIKEHICTFCGACFTLKSYKRRHEILVHNSKKFRRQRMALYEKFDRENASSQN